MAAIKINREITKSQLQQQGVYDWPIGSKEISCFPWTYELQECCLILQGEVTVTPDNGDPVKIFPGDYVTFSKGLSCTWDIHQAIKKHYQFGE